jgi:Nickel responsive protein SCO4226-like
MPNFVVERYRPSSDPDSLVTVADRLIAGVRQVSPDGTSVRYVDTIYLPGDETCLHLFEAESEADVRAVTRQAGIEVDRIVPAEQIERREVG